jgi:hypothetical protein
MAGGGLNAAVQALPLKMATVEKQGVGVAYFTSAPMRERTLSIA